MADITARIKGDTSQYNQALRQAQTASGRLEDTTNRIGDSLTKSSQRGTKSLKIFRDENGRLRNEFGKFIKDVDRLGPTAKKSATTAKRGFAGFNKGLGAVRASVGAISRQILTFAGIGIGTKLLGDVTKLTLDLERAQAEVATIVDTATINLPEITARVREIAAAAGQDAVIAVKALYDAISAGQEPEQAVKLIATSAKLAKAGLTELKDSTDLLTTILNAYGISADKAALVSDALFKTVEKGKTTLPELTANLGKVIPIASQVGVGITDLGGALAALTAGGIRTDKAVTSLRALLNSVIKPSVGASGAAAQLGIDYSATALQAKGLVPFITELRERLKAFAAEGGNSQEVLGRLTGRVQALTAAASLTGNQFNKFNESAKAVNEGLGATDKAAAKIDKTFGQKLKVAAETIKKGFADVGLEATKLASALVDLGKKGDKSATGLLGVFGTGAKETAIATLSAIKGGVEALNGDLDGSFSSLKRVQEAFANFAESIARSPFVSDIAEFLGFERLDTAVKILEGAGVDINKALREDIDAVVFGDIVKEKEILDKAAEFSKKLAERLKVKDFAEEFTKAVDKARRELEPVAASIGKSLSDLNISDLSPDVRALFDGDVLKAAVDGIDTVKIEDAFKRSTKKGVEEGAEEGAKKAAQTIKQGLAEGTEAATGAGPAGAGLPDIISQVQTQFQDLELDVNDLSVALKATAEINPDPRAIKQASEEIRKLQGRINVFSSEVMNSNDLTDQELTELLAKFADFRKKVLSKIDPAELAEGIGRFMRKAVRNARAPTEQTGRLFSDATRRAKRPTTEVGKLFSDAAKLAKLTIDSPELLGLDPDEVARTLGGFGTETSIIVNDNLRLIRKATTKGFQVFFTETNSAVKQRFDELRASRRQQDGELSRTFNEGRSQVESSGRGFVSALRNLSGNIVSSISGVVRSTTIATENLTEAQRRQVNQILRAQQRAADLQLERSPFFFGAPSLPGGGRPTVFGGGFGFQQGGPVGGRGRGDRVPALLEPGEFVVPRDSAARFGPLLEAIRQAGLGGGGALAAPTRPPVQVENVTIQVNGADASVDEIADAVMGRVLRLGELGQLEQFQR